MKRKAGILLPISSLPSKYGIGTFGVEAYNFVDFMERSGLRIWQILPLTLTSFGDSPYQSPSSRALNPYFIDLDLLEEDGLLAPSEYETLYWGSGTRVNYEILFKERYTILKKAFDRFNRNDEEFKEFIEKGEYKDFAVFMTLKERHNYNAWYTWNDKFKNYSKEIENEVVIENDELVEFYEWTQFIFLKQFNRLKDYAHKKNISIMGDLPIYVAYDSVEVWKYPDLFQLDENYVPTRVAGCPPDCFSLDGQLWGNPLYNWDNMKKDDYAWWKERIKYNLSLYDLVRIDHFRGFAGYYSIPYGDKTARNGEWVKGPGAEVFKGLTDLPIVAEDLGQLDDDFYKMMKTVGFPGMKIVTQGFDGDPNNIWKPSNYTENFFSYSGTHDSQTTRQFIEELDKNQRKVFLSDLKAQCEHFKIDYDDNFSDRDLTLKVCELNFMSPAEVAICPMQDFLAVGKEGRMNFPSTLSIHNWSWRMSSNVLSTSLSNLLLGYSKEGCRI
jgi:4-alpha-glucanotransferase